MRTSREKKRGKNRRKSGLVDPLFRFLLVRCSVWEESFPPIERRQIWIPTINPSHNLPPLSTDVTHLCCHICYICYVSRVGEEIPFNYYPTKMIKFKETNIQAVNQTNMLRRGTTILVDFENKNDAGLSK